MIFIFMLASFPTSIINLIIINSPHLIISSNVNNWVTLFFENYVSNDNVWFFVMNVKNPHLTLQLL